MRPLNDRIAEAMRRASIGFARPLWADCTETTRDDWRRRADHLLTIAPTLGLFIASNEERHVKKR